MTESNNQIAPFGQSRSLMATDPSAVAAGEAVKARIQSAYVMAYQKPRNIDQARVKILKMCENPEFAEKVEYSKPIGGKKIRGLSIRFAEMALALYENVLTEAQLLFEDDNIKRIRISTLDLEANTQFSRDISIKKTVERLSKANRDDDYISERQNSQGKTTYLLRATEDEVMVKESQYVSKFIRTEGLRLIPADIKEEAEKRARATLSKRDNADPSAAKKRVLDAFSGLNIWPKDIEKYIGHSADTISPAEIADLRTVYSAIESGEATWADYIGREKPDTKLKTPAGAGGPPLNAEPEHEKEEASIEPKTSPAFAALIKEQADMDFEYVPTKNGIAHDNLSAYLEFAADHQAEKTTSYEMMDMISAPGVFPGFWNGFVGGTWKKHFGGKLPDAEPAEQTQEKKTLPPSFNGHRVSPEGPPPGITIGGDKNKNANNQFDAVHWESSKMAKVSLARFWEANKTEWNAAKEKTKIAFEKKWILRFTENGSLTLLCPWKKEEPKQEEMSEAAVDSDSEIHENIETREPGDELPDQPDPQDQSTVSESSKNSSINYNGEKGIALFAQIQIDDPGGLINACEAIGYGKNMVVPLSADARKKLHEKYLELKN